MLDGIEEAVRARQPDYPPKQSMSGNNTFTVRCSAIGYMPGYCVCLHKLAAYERDGKLDVYSECEKAISFNECPAQALRQQERDAGKALFYVDRNLLREEMDRRLAEQFPNQRQAAAAPRRSAWEIAKSPMTNKPAFTPSKPVARPPAPKPQVADQYEDGYAAAINAAISQIKPEQAEQPEQKVVAPSPSPAKKGLSLLEIARMQMGNNSGEKNGTDNTDN